ncbi:hypothetical protein EPN96_08575 [bacterium]|nr:MAG: hypothetical protein EPN96_08575 [bacterium]
MQRRKLLAFAVAFLLAFSPALRAFALSKSEEGQLGRRAVAQVEKAYRISEDPFLDVYLNKIAQKVEKAMGEAPFPIRVKLIADPSINAFAIPGGNVYLTTGILYAAAGEEELAGLLAHEMSHVYGRHIVNRFEKAEKVQLATAAAVLAGLILGMSGSSDLGMAAMTFGIAAGETKMLSYSRADEEDADRRALRALKASGYSGWGMVTLMDTLRKNSSTPEGYPAYLLSHPPPESRVGYLSAELGPQPAEGYPEGRDEFLLAQIRALGFDKRPWGRAHALELADKNPEKFERQLGAEIVLRSEGDITFAKKYLELAGTLRPRSDELLYEAALLKSTGEEPGLLQQALEEAVKTNPDSIPLKRTLSKLLVEKGDYAGALALLESLEASGDRWDKLPYQKGMALGGLGRTAEGFALLGDFYAYSNPELALGYLRKALAGTEDSEKKAGLKKEIERISGEMKSQEIR